MKTKSQLEKDAVEALCAVTRLLSRAAEQAWREAAEDGPFSPLHLLGLGAHLAAGQAANLVPLGAEIDAPAPVQTDPLMLLRAAEELTRVAPIEAFPPGTSDLVVALCDLIREATP